MKFTDGRLIYSPSDLIVFVESPFASWMDRRYLEDPDALSPDPDDPMLRLLPARGYTHEGRHLAALQSSDQEFREIPPANSIERTRDALREGADIIYQAHLESGEFAGYADFLRRDPSPSAALRYAVWDTKLSHHPKPYYLIQLCCCGMSEQMGMESFVDAHFIGRFAIEVLQRAVGKSVCSFRQKQRPLFAIALLAIRGQQQA